MSAHHGHLRSLLDETREEINRADGKANLLLTAAGLGVAALVAGLVAGDIDPMGAAGAVQVTGSAAGVLLAAGLTAVGAAVFPRLGDPMQGRAHYFMEAAQFDDAESLHEAIVNDHSAAGARESQQLLVLSKAVRYKYRLIRLAQVLLGAGMLSAAAAALLHGAVS